MRCLIASLCLGLPVVPEALAAAAASRALKAAARVPASSARCGWRQAESCRCLSHPAESLAVLSPPGLHQPFQFLFLQLECGRCLLLAPAHG